MFDIALQLNCQILAFKMLFANCGFIAALGIGIICKPVEDLIHTLVEFLPISVFADLKIFHFCLQEFKKSNLAWRKGEHERS